MEIQEETGRATMALMESRLLRAEHLLYGSPDPAREPERHNNFVHPPAVDSIADIERQLNHVISTTRVYADLIKIYRAYPSLFEAPAEGVVPTQLSDEEIKQCIFTYRNGFPAVASGLNKAINDLAPIPDASLSAQLIALVPRMEALAEKQKGIDDEIAELRRRSERAVRRYYEKQALAASNVVADVETRIERAEGHVRRLEKAAAEAAKVGV